MQQQYAPISDSIGNRFAHTQYVVVRAWNKSVNSSQATVGVVVTEVLKPPLPAVVYSGTWRVIHGSGGWLLDQPHLALTGPGGRAESQQQSNGNGHD
jgi:hypothetical protein